MTGVPGIGIVTPMGIGRLVGVTALISASLVLAGCGSYFLPRQQKASAMAAEAGWEYRIVTAGPFAMASALGPAARRSQTLVVYLEGDGRAFLGSNTVSTDPTPTEPYALRLALAHPVGAAAYLARPCQYMMTPACVPQYWTSHRYAPDIIAAVSDGISQLQRRVGASRLILVGYSGGGALAALVAATRNDVSALVTIAANLDLAEWTSRDGLTPLWGSKDPAESAMALAHLPQVHLVGGRDTVVPPQVARSFLARMRTPDTARIVEQPDFGHDCCWAEDWPRLAHLPALTALPGWAGP